MSNVHHPFFITTTIAIYTSMAMVSCASPTPSQPLTILPTSCEVNTTGQIGLTLNGDIAPNARVSWQARSGSIVENAQGFSATYTAPSVIGEDVITATITPGIKTTSDTLTVICRILEAIESAPPVSTQQTFYSVVISEVMGNPCGDLNSRRYNQYVELYNYGDQPIDVGYWWLFDEGEAGTPDHLVAWNSRSASQLNSSLVTTSTVIPARGFAVILPPLYTESDVNERMPYNFPAGTVILTAESSQTLGDDFFGIISSEDGYDTVTLYIGGPTVIDLVIDTYGTPAIGGSHPLDIDDNHVDNLPLYLSECEAAERIDPHKPDSVSNWNSVRNGTPGDGPYQ